MANSWDPVIETAEYRQNLDRIMKIAHDNGYVLNPDGKRCQKVIGLMTMNHMNHGEYYCPCKQSHPLDPQKDVTCPCREREDEIAKDGKCFCKLFFNRL